MASMPHLVRWHDELGDLGLIVIGLHRQSVATEQLKDRCNALGIRFTITDGGEIGGQKDKGFPSCVVIGHDGQCLYDGHPKNVEAVLRKAVGAMLTAEYIKPAKSLEPVIDLLNKGGSVVEALKKLSTLKNSSEKATREQATELYNRILEGSRKRLDMIKVLQLEDPVTAYDNAVTLATRWKGFDPGTKAAEIVAKLKQDKTVSAELKARPSLESIKKLDEALERAAGTAEIGSAEFKKKFATQIREMKTVYDRMKRQYPESKSTREAEVIVGKYELAAGSKK